jgi:hypothetical protein
MKKLVVLPLLLLGVFLFVPGVAFAAGMCPGGDCRNNVGCEPPCVEYKTTVGQNQTCRCVTPTPKPVGGGTTPSISNPCDQDFTWTALGCIPNNPRDFVIWIMGRAIGIGGGIAFLLMLFGGFQVITSTGDPERLNSGKEIIGSAISGLLLIIFSLFILELIGVDILGLGNVGFKFGSP